MESRSVSGSGAGHEKLVLRGRLVDRLHGPEQLCVVFGRSGTGKSVLLSQWAERSASEVVWLDLRSSLPSRSGFWLRVFTQLHASGIINDALLAREFVTVSESPVSVRGAIDRVLDAAMGPLALVIDGVPRAGEIWAAIVDDLVTVLESRPSLRCLIACNARDVRDEVLSRDAFPVTAIEIAEGELQLSQAEAQEIVDCEAPVLPGPVRSCLLASGADQRADELQFRIHHPDRSVGSSAPPYIERLEDDRLRDFAGITALAPTVDATLARDLSGLSDVEELFARLTHIGVGAWTTRHGGERLFRYTDGFMHEARLDFAARRPRLVRTAQSTIARWLARRGVDHGAALAYALDARDFDLAAGLALRAFPFNYEEQPRLRTLLRAVPAPHIHRRPILALWYGLLLNQHPETQKRATEFFLSAAALGKLRFQSMPLSERAVMSGFESVIWRLTGRAKKMTDAARRCVALFTEAYASSDFDPSLREPLSTVLNHSGVSLLAAYEHDDAGEAFATLIQFADDQHLRHRRNQALVGLAATEALSGRIVRAQRTLARVDDADWPTPWRTGYVGALSRIATAEVELSRFTAQQSINTLALLDPHFDTIEFWDLIATIRALAECRLGHRQAAAERFARVARERLTRSALPGSRARVAATSALLRILNGRTPARAHESTTRSQRSVLLAMDAMKQAAQGESAAASSLLQKADEASRSVRQEAIVASASAACAARLGWNEELSLFGARLAALVADEGIRWPVLFLTSDSRERIVRSLVDAGQHASASSLNATFDAIEPVMTDEAWRALSRPKLTARENAVLRALFSTGNRADLAEQLYVSVNTVKSQLRSLYAKLDAANRDEALARAIALGLPESDESAESEGESA